MKVEWGSLVWLDYDAFLDTGKLFDSSEVNGSLRLHVGEWQALPGLGEKLLGLQEGDERLIRLCPAEAFGEWDLEAVLTMWESRLTGEVPLKDGMMLKVETTTGLSAVCQVYRISDDRVALDFNHPLAGEPLTLFVRVRKVVPPSRSRLAVVLLNPERRRSSWGPAHPSGHGWQPSCWWRCCRDGREGGRRGSRVPCRPPWSTWRRSAA